ncbi:caspase 8 [Pelomyxa schiedti]|nr:caspase 8 [Pelomyxa schiedti]
MYRCTGARKNALTFQDYVAASHKFITRHTAQDDTSRQKLGKCLASLPEHLFAPTALCFEGFKTLHGEVLEFLGGTEEAALMSTTIQKYVENICQPHPLRIAFFGPEGSGKSALLDCLCGGTILPPGHSLCSYKVCLLRFAKQSNACVRIGRILNGTIVAGEVLERLQDCSSASEIGTHLAVHLSNASLPNGVTELQAWLKEFIIAEVPLPLLETGIELANLPGSTYFEQFGDILAPFLTTFLSAYLPHGVVFSFTTLPFGPTELKACAQLKQILSHSASDNIPEIFFANTHVELQRIAIELNKRPSSTTRIDVEKFNSDRLSTLLNRMQLADQRCNQALEYMVDALGCFFRNFNTLRLSTPAGTEKWYRDIVGMIDNFQTACEQELRSKLTPIPSIIARKMQKVRKEFSEDERIIPLEYLSKYREPLAEKLTYPIVNDLCCFFKESIHKSLQKLVEDDTLREIVQIAELNIISHLRYCLDCYSSQTDAGPRVPPFVNRLMDDHFSQLFDTRVIEEKLRQVFDARVIDEKVRQSSILEAMLRSVLAFQNDCLSSDATFFFEVTRRTLKRFTSDLKTILEQRRKLRADMIPHFQKHSTNLTEMRHLIGQLIAEILALQAKHREIDPPSEILSGVSPRLDIDTGGRGTSALEVVWENRHMMGRELDMAVATKAVQCQFFEDAFFRHTVEDTALNILPFQLLFKQADKWFMICPRFSCSLKDYLLKYISILSLTDVAFIAQRVISGIRDIHKFGIVHGDIRLENILVNVLGTKVTDLAIAGYGLSAELGQATISCAKDIVSFGVMLAEMTPKPSLILEIIKQCKDGRNTTAQQVLDSFLNFDPSSNVHDYDSGDRALFQPRAFMVDWGETVHKGNTWKWLCEAGFDEEWSSHVSKSCQKVDDALSTTPSNIFSAYAQSWHFNINHTVEGGHDSDSRLQHCLQQLRKALGKSVRREAAKNLGKGLHPLQDVFAHADEFVTVVRHYNPLGSLSTYSLYWTHANRRGWNADEESVVDFTDKEKRYEVWEPTRESPCDRDRGQINGRLALTRLATWLYALFYCTNIKPKLVQLIKEDMRSWKAKKPEGLGLLYGFVTLFKSFWEMKVDEELKTLLLDVQPVSRPRQFAIERTKDFVLKQHFLASEYIAHHTGSPHYKSPSVNVTFSARIRLVNGEFLRLNSNLWLRRTAIESKSTIFEFCEVSPSTYRIMIPDKTDSKGRPRLLDCKNSGKHWVGAWEQGNCADDYWWFHVGDDTTGTHPKGRLGMYRFPTHYLMAKYGDRMTLSENSGQPQFEIIRVTPTPAKRSLQPDNSATQPKKQVTTTLCYSNRTDVISVSITCNLNSWEPIPMTFNSASGYWIANLRRYMGSPLLYKFLVTHKDGSDTSELDSSCLTAPRNYTTAVRGASPEIVSLSSLCQFPEESDTTSPTSQVSSASTPSVPSTPSATSAPSEASIPRSTASLSLAPVTIKSPSIDTLSVDSFLPRLQHGKNGYLLFANTTKDRSGAENDLAIIQKAFGSFFHILYMENPIKENLIRALTKISAATDNSLANSFVFVSGSHGGKEVGGKDCLLDVDGQKISVHEDIMSIFTCTRSPTLQGKAKFFLIAACRGPQKTPAVEIISRELGASSSKSCDITVEEGDMVLVHSTLADSVSYRDYSGTLLFHALHQAVRDTPRRKGSNGIIEPLPVVQMLFSASSVLRRIAHNPTSSTTNGSDVQFIAPSNMLYNLTWHWFDERNGSRSQMNQSVPLALNSAAIQAAPEHRAITPLWGPELDFNCFAFVIGNQTYMAGLLQNALNDAKCIAEFLSSKCKFDVTHLTDVPSREAFYLHLSKLRADMKAKSKSSGKKNACLLYFAGHGLQKKGQNFLLMTEYTPPVGSKDEKFTELEAKAPILGAVINEIKAESDLVIVILDCCRASRDPNEALPRGAGVAAVAKPGLAAVQLDGCIIFYPTSPGMSAADGGARRPDNGLFTGCFLDVVETAPPCTSFDQIVNDTMGLMRARSDQRPWTLPTNNSL